MLNCSRLVKFGLMFRFEVIPITTKTTFLTLCEINNRCIIHILVATLVHMRLQCTVAIILLRTLKLNYTRSEFSSHTSFF